MPSASPAECATPHTKLVFDLLVAQHPSFSTFLVQDEDGGWAQKTPDGDRMVRRESTASWKQRLKEAVRPARVAG
jgi:hypothetical protein